MPLKSNPKGMFIQYLESVQYDLFMYSPYCSCADRYLTGLDITCQFVLFDRSEPSWINKKNQI